METQTADMESARIDSTHEGSKSKKNKVLIAAHSDILKRAYSRERANISKSKSKSQIRYELNNQLFGHNPKVLIV